MDMLAFAKMTGFKQGDAVTVDASMLQEYIKDYIACQDKLKKTEEKLEKAYTRNEDDMEVIMVQSETIKELTNNIESLEEIAGKTRKLRNDYKKVSEKLSMTQLFLERRQEREKYSNKPLHVDLTSYKKQG